MGIDVHTFSHPAFAHSFVQGTLNWYLRGPGSQSEMTAHAERYIETRWICTVWTTELPLQTEPGSSRYEPPIREQEKNIAQTSSRG